jgi:hypothetical protein
MRAFLSTGAGHHPADGSRYVCGLNVDSAMSEARAILAETEPTGYSLGAPHAEGDYLPASDVRSLNFSQVWDDARIGLAESLAAFIEQEF